MENGVVNYGRSRTGKLNYKYFAPQMVKNKTRVLLTYPMAAMRLGIATHLVFSVSSGYLSIVSVYIASQLIVVNTVYIFMTLPLIGAVEALLSIRECLRMCMRAFGVASS